MKYFTMEELIRSDTARAKGIDNTPTPEHVQHLIETVERMVDPLRDRWAVVCANEQLGTPQIRVSSGYRSPALNRAVGGSSTSAHVLGYALDLVPLNGQLRRFKEVCRDFLRGKKFDQMISEDEDSSGIPKWIHLGYKNAEGKQRRQFLSMRSGKYIPMTV